MNHTQINLLKIWIFGQRNYIMKNSGKTTNLI